MFYSVLDAYGHLSSRHPENPELFIMPRNMAPATITGMDDLVTYRVADASAVNENAPKGYIEHFIHSEIYKAYPSIGSVLHSHCSDVLLFANSSKTTKGFFHLEKVVLTHGRRPSSTMFVYGRLPRYASTSSQLMSTNTADIQVNPHPSSKSTNTTPKKTSETSSSEHQQWANTSQNNSPTRIPDSQAPPTTQ